MALGSLAIRGQKVDWENDPNPDPGLFPNIIFRGGQGGSQERNLLVCSPAEASENNA